MEMPESKNGGDSVSHPETRQQKCPSPFLSANSVLSDEATSQAAREAKDLDAGPELPFQKCQGPGQSNHLPSRNAC